VLTGKITNANGVLLAASHSLELASAVTPKGFQYRGHKGNWPSAGEFWACSPAV
jgi:hypothetical protein